MNVFSKYNLSICLVFFLFCSCTLTPYSIGEKWAKNDLKNNIFKYKTTGVPISHGEAKTFRILVYLKYGLIEQNVTGCTGNIEFFERVDAYNQVVSNYFLKKYGYNVFDSVQEESKIINNQILQSYKTLEEFWNPYERIHRLAKDNIISSPSEPISQTAISKFGISNISVIKVASKESFIDSFGYQKEYSRVDPPDTVEIKKLMGFLQRK